MARRPGRTIDFKAWDGIPGISLNTASDTTLSGGALVFDGAATILRCRGTIQAQLDESKQVGDVTTLTFGLGIVSADAFALGPTSFPDPGDEAQYSWLWWYEMKLRAAVAAGEEAYGASCHVVELDTKAMRCIRPAEALVIIVQNVATTGAPVVDIDIGQIRVLIGT